MSIILLTMNAFATTVTNTNDSGAGSLRHALLTTPAGGTIDFSLSNCPCTITLTSGELFIDKGLTLRGPGAGLLTISAAGNPFRVMRIEGPPGAGYIKVVIDGIRMADGRGGTEDGTLTVGGGIFNKNADTTITNAIIANNYATGSGGGAINRSGVLRLVSSSVIANTGGMGGGIRTDEGALVISYSRFADNQANMGLAAIGGAVLAYGSTVTISDTTITRNRAVYDSGLALNNSNAEISRSTFDNNFSLSWTIGRSGTLKITDSTISGNTGGSIFSRGETSITSCTIVRNSDFLVMGGATIPGGVVIGNEGSTTIRNSIIAENESGDVGSLEGGSLLVSGGFNLIGDPRDFGSAFTQTGDQTGTMANPLDPKLLPLADNGGATQTHTPRLDSPALDRGFAFGDAHDQRAYARSRDFDNIQNVQGGDGTDIGAVELVIDEWISGRVVLQDGRGLRGARVTIIHLSGRSESVVTGTLGYYSFPAMLADGIHVIRVDSKRYRFESYSHDFTGDATEFEFLAME